jgi:hypothetical protein
MILATAGMLQTSNTRSLGLGRIIACAKSGEHLTLLVSRPHFFLLSYATKHLTLQHRHRQALHLIAKLARIGGFVMSPASTMEGSRLEGLVLLGGPRCC